MDTKRVALLVFPDTNLLDAAGPAQVFQTAAEQLHEKAGVDAAYRVELLSREGGLVRSSPGVELMTRSLAEVEPRAFDTVLISGGHGATDAAEDPRLLAWLAGAGSQARRVGAICTGAFVLAAAGLLKCRRAATHWAYCHTLQENHPDIEVDGDSIFVEDNGCWTSAGVTSGIDMALAMVEADYGREISLLVARRLVVYLRRPGGQSQFSSQLQAQFVDGPLAPLLQWIAANPTADLRTEALAGRANMSLRNFFRAFESATGHPPAEWVELARLQVARQLLEQSEHSVQEVARRSGFGSADRLRRVFLRHLGVLPTDYRERFTGALAASTRQAVPLAAPSS